jgi:hypothetical protein
MDNRTYNRNSILSFFPFFSLLDFLCDPTDLIWRKGIPFEAIIGRKATSSDFLLAEVFLGHKAKSGDMCTAPGIISLSSSSLATDVTLRANGLWLGTRTGAGGIAILA